MLTFRHHLWLITALVLSLFTAKAQEGPHRPSKKWKQIDTDTVQVIYGKGMEKQAQRVASLVHYLADSSRTSSIGHKQGKVSIILRNETTTPNGFVSISPFRSEFFTTPPQYNFSGTTDWLDLLTIHEYRHVQQNINAKVGVTKLGSILFGQNGWGFMTGTALPRWYSEGDAVVTETALSQSGRGRMPSFDMEYRAVRQAGYQYSYEKASASSFKHYVPNHYVLGYYLTAYARQQFGQEVWAKVLNDAGKFNSILYPFSRSLKKHTGLTTPALYKATFNYLDSLYAADAKEITPTASKQANPSPKVYTEYHQPIFISQDQLLVVKSGFEDVRTFYLIEADGTEKKLFQTGIQSGLNFQLSFSNGVMAWSEAGFHPRWTMEDYSNIFTRPLRAGALGRGKLKLSNHGKYFSPALSPNALRVVAVEQPNASAGRLVILNNAGQVIKVIDNTEGYQWQQPRWLSDGKSIVCIVRKNQQNALAQVDSESGEVSLLTAFTTELMAHPYPSPNGKWVFFDASYTGINNIFAVKLGDQQVYQVGSSKIGAFEPSVSPNSKKLAFVEFSALGHQVKIMDIEQENWKPISTATDNILTLHKAISEQEGGDILQGFQEQTFDTKSYSPLAHFFNPHSWNPVLSDPDQRELGLDLEVDDKMGTFSTTVSYRYNLNEERGRVSAEAAYAGLFPVLKAGIVGKNERVASKYILEPTDTTLVRIDTTVVNNQQQYDSVFSVSYNSDVIDRTWQESSVYAGVTLPFNLTFKNVLTNLNLSLDWHLMHLSEARDGRADENLQALDWELDFVSVAQKAPRQIYPRYGIGIYGRHRQALGSDFYKGSSSTLLTYGYVPSLIKNHGFYWTWMVNSTNHRDNYQFRNLLGGSRGYGSQLHDTGRKFTLTYGFPILHPDISAGPFAFIKRIKAKVFYDESSYTINPFPATDGQAVTFPLEFSLRSTGVELLLDYRALRLLDIEMGLRYTYRNDYQFSGYSSPHLIEFVFVSVTP